MTWLIGLLFGRFPALAGWNWRVIGLFVAIAGFGVAYLGWHHHVFQQGADSRDAYYKPILAARDATIADQTAKALKAKAEADGLTATLGALAKQIGDERVKADADLDEYRRTHPVRIIVREPAAACSGGGSVSETARIAGEATEAAAVLQPQAARDIGPAIEALLAEADGTNEDLRMCETQYRALAESLTR